MSEAEVLPDVRRVKTPVRLQMEEAECGAVCLGILLSHYGKHVSLEELRTACRVSRDGCNAQKIIEAGTSFGLSGKGFRYDLAHFAQSSPPLILHWCFEHYVVFEGVKKGVAYINDPATGPRTVSMSEFDRCFTGIVLVFEKLPEFREGGKAPSPVSDLLVRLKGNGKSMWFLALAGLALVIPGIVTPVFFKIFVDEILINRMSSWAQPLFLGMLAGTVVRGILLWLRSYFLTRAELSMSIAHSGEFLWHLLRLPVTFFHQRMGGELSTRMELNARVARLLTSELSAAILDIVVVVFYLILMFFYDTTLALAGLGVSLLNLFYLGYISRIRTAEIICLTQEQGKLAGVGISGLKQIETLKAGGLEDEFFSRWAGHHSKVINGEQRLGRLTHGLMVAPPFLAALNTGLILIWGSFRVLDGAMTVGMLVAFQLLINSVLKPIASLVNLGAELQQAKSDLLRLNDVLACREDPIFADKITETETPKRLSGHMELRNVTFGYNKGTEPMIREFNLTVTPGQRIALVGRSGSGKSTVAHLVCGFIPVWSGEILFDGKPAHLIRRDVLCQSLGLVDQNISLFEGTIRENLTMWHLNLPEAELIQATMDAGIHESLTARPGGLDGLVHEGGANFSGGQRQQLEIARALVGDPSLLVLDEATSALDSSTEHLVNESIRRRGCACLIVAHRLSTVVDCDEILVMHEGHVIQRGRHKELIDQPGLYADLIREVKG